MSLPPFFFNSFTLTHSNIHCLLLLKGLDGLGFVFFTLPLRNKSFYLVQNRFVSTRCCVTCFYLLCFLSSLFCLPSLLTSVSNLHSFPSLRKREGKKTLKLPTHVGSTTIINSKYKRLKNYFIQLCERFPHYLLNVKYTNNHTFAVC